MNPKEKAIKLTDKFSKLGAADFVAKECALVCVDELNKFLEFVRYEDGFFYYDDKKYLRRVKQEIEKL